MWMQIIKVKLVTLLLVGVAAFASSARAGQKQNAFYRAYYMEHVDGDFAGAAKLYEVVVADQRVDAVTRAKAQAGLRACREEQASMDFAALVPETTIAFIELHQPGEQVKRLLNQLGLLGDDDNFAADASGRRRVSISPKLVNELLGLRGAAVAMFETGDVSAAIQLEKNAIELADGKVAPDLQQSLLRFETSLAEDQQLANRGRD